MTKIEALELSLYLAITAPNDEKADECIKMADELSIDMDKADVELAMKNTLDKVMKTLEKEKNEQ